MARAQGGRSISHNRKHQRTHTDNRSQAAARVSSSRARASGPSSIHDVYQFLTNDAGDDGTSSARKGKGKASSAERRLKRALVNDAADEDADVRRGGGGGDVDSDQEAGASLEASGSRGRGPASFLDVNSEEENRVLEEDDEEIDSDEAWDEADEHRFADLLPVSNRASKRKRANNDGDGDDDDDDDDDMMDISRMLQDTDEEDDAAATQSDSGAHEDNSDDDEDDGNALQRRMAALAAVPTSTAGPQPDDDDDDDDERPERKRRLLSARTEAVPESAYSAAGSGGRKVRVEDLLAGLGQTGASFTDLRNTAKTLSDVKRAHARDGSGGGGGGGGASKRKGGAPLQAPLPSILQDRIDRAAAHEQSKAEVEGWAPTIKRLREAEHLSFPLQDEKVVPQSVAALTSSENVKPANDMERSIAALLAQEGMTDRNVGKAEELAMNERGMDREQIKKRREELRHMRELLFREEQKAKRVRKIKSKTYRKIARKQRERQKASEKEAGLGSGGEEEGEEEEDRMEAERDRAMERATLKHKNTGGWAKNLVGKHATMENVEARNAIEEQLLRGERLRRRIQGAETDDEAEESDESESDDADQPDEDPFDELRRLQGEEEKVAAAPSSSSSGKKAAVWDMKFMSDARKRDAQQRRDEVDDFEREMAALDKQGVGEHEENMAATVDGVRSSVQGNTGRATYAPKQARGAASTDRLATQASQSRSVDDEETLQPSAFESSKPILVSQPKSSVARGTSVEAGAAAAAAAANPWMSSSSHQGSKVSRKKNETLVAKDASALDRAANRMQRHRAKGEEGRMNAEDDARLEIDPEARLRFAGAESGESALAAASAKRPSQADEPDNRQHSSAGSGSGSDSDSSSESDEPALVSAQRNASRGGEIRIPGALQQRDLVAEAFAGDDVSAEFEADKKAIMERDAPMEVDETLPGWGSWGGKGVKKARRGRGQEQQRKYTRTIAGLEASQRKDANMKGVIINEKRDKKADKFKAKDLPFPYTSAAQYQLAMQNPIGPEWNTRTTHQRLTLPRVVTKPGKAILPIQRKF
ncbi:Utp14-domain-containing protein [Ceraceosorus guamensis]|uniref:Utp14-domain-containing protein n=1 Tax=Ceraceosorus guamensis TaxID=1522189 RepID=A0A316VNB2_9BASI|nr:Utp14-domain-containing protein [Ceraceosorus guamensis]PWN38794.1 Utp14-domain-containing protein [Ceraceosorus guamensis]